MKAIKAVILILLLLIVASTIPLFADRIYPLDSAQVNSFDRIAMHSHSRGLDIAGDIACFATMATPTVLLGLPSDQGHIVGIMYAETLALSLGASTLMKNLIHRDRPYLYFEGYPQNEVDSGESGQSFPSRHSILAFASATFTSYVYSKYYPDSEWKIPIIALSYGLAATTSALRVMSGNHFLTDVLAGALIGTAIGLAVPAIHTTMDNRGNDMPNPPFGLMFSIVLD